ncbi:hypothetical protein [Streptomyces sp. NPDC050738]|uniref:hypothetical protein n=1 Tax=Streptomyces sp. NPDC050738 TaxID=3154744 RepID=UPI00342B3A91
MSTSTVRNTCTAVVAAVALTGIAACGSGGSGGGGAAEVANPIAALRLAQQKTSGAKSAKVEGTTVMGSAVSMKQSGVMAWSNGVTGTMDITYTAGSMADSMKQMGSDGTAKARYLHDAYYVNMGDAFAKQTGGKHWIEYRYADLSKIMGASGDAMKDQMQNTTPDQGVKSLLASGDVKKVGAEDVRGVSATHYSGTVDVARLTAKNSSLSAEKLDELKAQLEKSGITTEQVDIWVDKDNLLVKKVERGQMKTGELNSTVYYSDYGTSAPAEAPPAGDTVDFTQLIKKQ